MYLIIKTRLEYMEKNYTTELYIYMYIKVRINISYTLYKVHYTSNKRSLVNITMIEITERSFSAHVKIRVTYLKPIAT